MDYTELHTIAQKEYEVSVDIDMSVTMTVTEEEIITHTHIRCSYITIFIDKNRRLPTGKEYNQEMKPLMFRIISFVESEKNRS